MVDIICDVHEPDEALPLLSQSVEAEKEAINNQGYADYLWQGAAGKEQFERKTWFEVLSSMDSVEDQLRREVQAYPEVQTRLVIEGIATPGPTGSVSWTMNAGRKVFYPKHRYAASMGKVYAWIYQVQKFVEVYFTPDYHSTILLLVACYNSAQKEEHSTFSRYLRNMDWHPNPQVEALMNISKSAGIGQARAKALITRFGTLWNVLNQSPETLATVDKMGIGTAKKLLRKVGRTDA